MANRPLPPPLGPNDLEGEALARLKGDQGGLSLLLFDAERAKPDRPAGPSPLAKGRALALDPKDPLDQQAAWTLGGLPSRELSSEGLLDLAGIELLRKPQVELLLVALGADREGSAEGELGLGVAGGSLLIGPYGATPPCRAIL